MNVKAASAAFGAALLLAGCATAPMQTASGRPEIVVSGKTTEQIRTAAVNQFLNRGFQLRNSDPLALVFEKDAGLMAGIFFGSQFNPRAVTRLRINIVDQGNGTHRIVGTPFMVSNPGSGFESEQPMENRGYRNMTDALEVLQANLEGREPVARAAPVPDPVPSRSVGRGNL